MAADPLDRTVRTRLPLAALLVLAVLLSALPAGAVGDVNDTINIVRPVGSNPPADVAIRLSQATFGDGGADHALLATDAAFADALASGTLQADDTPLLLTGRTSLRTDVATELQRLGVEDVTILGGEAAVDDDVVEDLEDLGIEVFRLAGATRFHTAAAIAAEVPDADTAIIARGFSSSGDDTQAFADALAAGGWAAEEGWPVLLTQPDSLPGPTREALTEGDIEEVFILGGIAAIDPAVEQEIADLGIDVYRVAGVNRFATAVQVARERRFRDAEDAPRIILAEGQADTAWAAGFAAAAHAARAGAPIILANGDAIPPESAAFLEQTAFQVDVGEITVPVLICAASPVACDQARALLGLPQEATVELDLDRDGGAPSGSTLTGTVDLHGLDAEAALFGLCVPQGMLEIGEGGAIALPLSGPPGDCELEFVFTFPNGTVQRLPITIAVLESEPLTGPVTNTETGGDAYTFVPEGADAPRVVRYDADDLFTVDGEPATIGAFEAAITVADQITYRAETDEGTTHDLVNVTPDTITQGTVGNVDLSQGTLAIVEPVTGVTLRPGLDLDDAASFRISASTVGRAQFEANLSEGDTLEISDAGDFTLRDRRISGTARDVQVDQVEGLVRFKIGGLGDDPFTAQDERYRAAASAGNQEFRVDGEDATFAEFAAALTEGDLATYDRRANLESFTLVNRAAPAVQGLVTETFNPDGSPVAPEPTDGGEITLLTDTEGRRTIRYSADAVFRIDGAIATEAEFEAARTAGDRVTYQPGDPGTATAEEIALVNRDLTGTITDIVEGADTYDVVTLAGVVYDDLVYTGAVFGGTDSYYVDDGPVGLAQFEQVLGEIDAGSRAAQVVVRGTATGTEHRLTTEPVAG